MSRKDSPEQAVQKQSAPAGVAALERGLSILRTLGQQEGLSLTEIAQRSDLNKATALRLLRTLEQQGFVWRDGKQLYYFGYALAVITRNLSMDNWLASSMQPELDWLAKQTGETASFFTCSGEQRLCVAVAMGWRDVGHRLCTGDTLPMTGASGHVLTALSDGQPKDYEFKVFQSLGERVAELAALAVPVFSGDGKLLGALGLSGTRTRFQKDEYRQELCAHLGASLKRIHSAVP
ncbi:IclR family transcriptional regulator [Alcaligenes nematophilus]